MRSPRPLEVAPLDASEIADAGVMLSRAFQTDPLWTATIRNPERRPEMLVRMFTGVTKTTIAAHGVAKKTPALTGVALWLPPGRDHGLWAMVRSGLAMPRFVKSLPRQDRKRMMIGLRQIGARKKVLMPEPHWYVAAIGVDPDLETETERNVGFHQRLGFDVVEEFTPEGPDVPMWLMARRDASSRPQPASLRFPM